jgi:hypothetical protein
MERNYARSIASRDYDMVAAHERGVQLAKTIESREYLWSSYMYYMKYAVKFETQPLIAECNNRNALAHLARYYELESRY